MINDVFNASLYLKKMYANQTLFLYFYVRNNNYYYNNIHILWTSIDP